MSRANGQAGDDGKAGTALRWSGRVLSADDLRQNLNGQSELVLSPRTVVTPMALDQLRACGVRIVREQKVQATDPSKNVALWGYAQEKPDPLVTSTIQSLEREGLRLKPLSTGSGESACRWARSLAECVARGECRGGVAFCQDPGLVCCVANKVKGLRAVPVCNVVQAGRAVVGLAANLVVVEMPGRTFFEVRQILRRVCAGEGCCPEEAAALLKELEGHAHR